jgi:hypothetical protein
MGDDQTPASAGHSNREESLLMAGMVRIMVCQRQWITEDSRGFLESKAIFPEILSLIWRGPMQNSRSESYRSARPGRNFKHSVKQNFILELASAWCRITVPART